MPGNLEQPKMDSRQAQDLLYDLLKLIPQYYPQWKTSADYPAPQDSAEREKVLALAEDANDFGMAFMKMAARMGEVIIEQLNRVPQKHFLTFLDFMGINSYPPRPARVPLTFVLAAGAKQAATVPRGTKVGVTNAIADAEEVVFETEADVTVNATQIKRLVSLNPATDQWTHHKLKSDGSTISEALIFHGDPAEHRIEHTLWLAHKGLLEINESTGLSIHLQLTSLAEQFETFIKSLRWEVSPNWEMQRVNVELSGRNVTISFPQLTKIEEFKLTSVDSFGRIQQYSSPWVRVKTTRALPEFVPQIQSIKLVVAQHSAEMPPDMVFANHSPIDLSKDFYPFNERPKFNDTVYIASERNFAKLGEGVDITVTLTPESSGIDHPNTTKIGLNWEYWNGNTWLLLGKTTKPPQAVNQIDFSDATQAFTQDGTVTFTCPTMEKTTINGQENYWLRIRIVEGNYGEAAHMILKDNHADPPTLEDYVYQEDSYKPPSIASIKITTAQTPVTPQLCFRSTAGLFLDVTNVRPVPIAEPVAERIPTLFIGLNALDVVTAESLNFYLQIQPRRFSESLPRIVSGQPDENVFVTWEYWNGRDWAQFSVEDETQNLTRPGLITFDKPQNMTKHTLFAEKLTWIRASLQRGTTTSPKLRGIYPNTVWATQAVSITNETLGSSNGQADQTFAFSKAPVLADEVIEVREPVVPIGVKGVREVTDSAGNVTEIWVQWQAVASFTASGSGDRHYTVDHTQGKINFGDGVNGLIPPVGKANVLAARYRSGGGRRGNLPSGTVSILKTTFPSVDSVVNHGPAIGGLDQEDIIKVMARGPHSIKNRGRAVTAEDFEWLAMQLSTQVARARCLSNRRMGPSGTLLEAPGWITLVIVPDEAGDRPLPDEALLKEVKKALIQRCLMSLEQRFNVIGPAYHEVIVEAVVVAQGDIEEKTLQGRVEQQIKNFLHPLYGGLDGGGWPFGSRVLLSEIINIIREAPGVERLVNINLQSNGESVASIPLAVDALPYSGRHRIYVERRDR